MDSIALGFLLFLYCDYGVFVVWDQVFLFVGQRHEVYEVFTFAFVHVLELYAVFHCYVVEKLQIFGNDFC